MGIRTTSSITYFYDGWRWYLATFQLAELAIYFDKDIDDPDEEKMDKDELFSRGFHSYWSKILRDNVQIFSEPTDSIAPIGRLQWYDVKESRSGGSQGVLGYAAETLAELQCVSVDCSMDQACGDFGTCTYTEDITLGFGEGALKTSSPGNVCKCSGFNTGHFCEYLNNVRTDEEGNVFLAIDLDPYVSPCYGPLVENGIFSDFDDCFYKLYPQV